MGYSFFNFEYISNLISENKHMEYIKTDLRIIRQLLRASNFWLRVFTVLGSSSWRWGGNCRLIKKDCWFMIISILRRSWISCLLLIFWGGGSCYFEGFYFVIWWPVGIVSVLIYLFELDWVFTSLVFGYFIFGEILVRLPDVWVYVHWRRYS
jgi:hypothetical protein